MAERESRGIDRISEAIVTDKGKSDRLTLMKARNQAYLAEQRTDPDSSSEPDSGEVETKEV
jgi:hypothetical protein